MGMLEIGLAMATLFVTCADESAEAGGLFLPESEQGDVALCGEDRLGAARGNFRRARKVCGGVC